MSKDLPSWAAGLDRNVFTSPKPSAEETMNEDESVDFDSSVDDADPTPALQTRARTSAGPTFAIRDPKARIEGSFETSESIEIGCEMSGDITCGQILIAQTGNVRAKVRAVDAVIAGRFEGDIIATGSIEVAATAVVSGTVQTDSFVVQRGARFTGTVQRLQPQPGQNGPTSVNGEDQRTAASLIAIQMPGDDPEATNGAHDDAAVFKDDAV